jgi:putative isomerase
MSQLKALHGKGNMNRDGTEQERALRDYILAKVDSTLRPPNRMMKHPFIDPGSVYEGNLWDWDSFWASYALLSMTSGAEPGMRAKRERFIEHARGNVMNFLDYQLDDGYLPMMIQEKDFPEPYLIRKHREGAVLNMHKPFLCQQIRLVSKAVGDHQWIKDRFEQIEAYFACYDRTYYFPSCGLYVWADDVMIGMDNDPAIFGRPRFSSAGIFLNGFMVTELQAAAEIADALGRPERAAHYRRKAKDLVAAVNAECWDPRDGFFYSVDVDVKTRSYDWFHVGLGVFWKTLPLKIRAWPGFLPLWNGTATREQAERMARHAADEATFCAPYGVTTLARDEKMFNLEPSLNPSNWLGGVWIIASYIVFRGLLNYGYGEQARTLRDKTLRLLGNDLKKTGTLHEFYNPFTGEPIMNPNFFNWNMLSVVMAEEAGGSA